MKILDAFKRRSGKDVESEARKQFNSKINREIAESVRFVAKLLQFPRFVVVEHGLQVGLRQLLIAAKDSERRKILANHLECIHLLGDGSPDDEVVLRLGEQNDTCEILAHAQPFLRAFRDLTRAISIAERSRDFELYERRKKYFIHWALKFAGWLEQPNRTRFKDKGDVQIDTSGDEKTAGDINPDEE